MDFLNQAIAQVNDLFRSMTPGARITSGLLLAVVVVSVGYLFQAGTAGPDEFLFGGDFLPPSQLNDIEAAFGQADLSDYRRERNRILVPRAEKALYLAAVAEAGAIPSDFHTYLENAVAEASAFESREAFRMRLHIANEAKLSDTIRQMKWVEDATVSYDEQQQRRLREKIVTASVSVQPIVGEVLTTRRKTRLKTLIAYSVAGMRLDDVAVINLGETDGFGSDGDFSPDDFNNDYYKIRVAYEQYKRQSILNVLADIPGVRVEVNAKLDDIAHETRQNVTPDSKPVAASESTVNEATERRTTNGGGRPGPIAQGPVRQGTTPQLAQQDLDTTTNEESQTNFVVGQEIITQERSGFTPTEVSATVIIPRRYIETVWKQHNPEATESPTTDELRIVQEELTTNVEEIVVPLLDQQNKVDNQFKQVKVVVIDTVDVPGIEPPSMANTALAWTGRYWTTLAMIGVAMFSLLVLKSVVSSTPQVGGPMLSAAQSVTVESGDTSQEGDPDSDEPERMRLKMKKGVSLKDDLAEMVKEDPEAAAAILQSWIGKAG